jgi:hypothetical protein
MDVVVTVPKRLWSMWLEEGDLAYSSGEAAIWERNMEYGFNLSGGVPKIAPGERVYIVAHGLLRGYAPLVAVEHTTRFGGRPGGFALVRRGNAVAVTLRGPASTVRGFQGWRYRWWDRDQEMTFPDWKTRGVR